MNLANILIKYIDLDTNKLPVDSLEFVEGILAKISPSDYMSCMKLILGDIPQISQISGDELLLLFFFGLEENNIIPLLGTHKQIGFK